MAAQIPCPHCREPAEIAEADLGRPHRCRGCGREFVPELASVAAVPPAPGPDPGWSPSQPTVLAAGSTFVHGRYLIRRKLGSGGMGTVYLAHDTQLGRDVALKLPRFDPDAGPAALDRFDREARTAAQLDHPHVCPVYDVGRVDGVPYLTMKYIEGEPLSPWVGGQLLPQRRAAEIVHELALVLAEAHAQGVVHRDLKPSNVMVHPRRGLVIMDFGLARRTGVNDPRLTESGAFLGTLVYVAPEQARDARSVGPACDVYSLGVILYELLTGRLPFEGTPAEYLGQKLYGTPTRPSAHRNDLDPDLETICLKSMAQRVEDRYASMTELAEALRGVLALKPRPKELVRTASEPTTRPVAEPLSVSAPPATGVAKSIGMNLVLIPPGEFLMGSPDSDKDARDWEEMPQHRVRITRPFYLGQYPVTIGQFRHFVATAGYRTEAEREGRDPEGTWQSPSFARTDEHPVVTLSWNDALAFCEWLSRQEHQTYRLPTEAEWEFACRAGTMTRYCFGDDAAKLGEYAWFRENSSNQTHPLGQKASNAWGLHDMHGNVWEWCLDGYWDAYYRVSPGTDPVGKDMASGKVARGGSWLDDARYARSASRNWFDPRIRSTTVGFRVVRVPPS